MFVSSAEANTSAGAPWLMWLASVDEDAKLMLAVASRLAALKALPISVNAPVSEAAANTVIVPVARAPGPVAVLAALPQADPIRAVAASSAHRSRIDVRTPGDST